MKPLHLCIPVLKRYDLLREMLLSLRESTVPVAKLCIVDNGRNSKALENALLDTVAIPLVDIFTPARPMGLAETWNYMIRHQAPSEERLIANDDLLFAQNSLELMMNTPGDLVSAAGISMCSCFILRDSCIAKVGYFDEAISPGYAYFEDNDYAERMFDAKATRGDASCGIVHRQSQTIAAYTEAEMREHQRKFEIAERNFIAKWGFHPRDHRPGRNIWEPMPISTEGA